MGPERKRLARELETAQAKSIVAHIEGRCEIPKERMTHHVAHWRLIPYFARFDRANYPRFWWRIKYGLLALWYLLRRNTPLRV